MLKFLKRFTLDVEAIRRSHDYRLLVGGAIISGLGSQAAMVALPIQIFDATHSPTLVGLLAAFELGPMIVVSQVGGVFLDRRDRRRVLATAEVCVMTVTGALFALTVLTHHPPVIAIFLLGGLLAGCAQLDSVSRNSILPNVLGPELLRGGLAFSYGCQQVAGIVGPGLGGVVAGVIGVKWVYLVDTASCVGLLYAALAIAPQPPQPQEHRAVLHAIAEGLRFVWSAKPLAAAFACDMNAMLFGMPRALFVVLSVTVYHAGDAGAGLLYAAISVGGAVSVLTSRWVQGVSRLGRVVLATATLWGLAIVGAGLVRTIALAVVCLVMAGWADGISAVARTTIAQTLTPDRLRGRMSGTYSLVVTSGPRLGDIESGTVAGAVGALNSVLLGGLGCLVGVVAVALRFPQLAKYDANSAMERLREENKRDAESHAATTAGAGTGLLAAQEPA